MSDPYSGKPGKTVVFVGNKASASERGYLPVLIYTLTTETRSIRKRMKTG
jgi:hypothetical protein